MNEKKAKQIVSHCEQMNALAKMIISCSAFVKAEMDAYLGGVGTTHAKRNNDLKNKSEQEAKIRAQFRKK